MKKFELKNEHVLILKKLSWQWADWDHGGIEVDAKRPFGYSGGIEYDIAEIIGLSFDKEEGLSYEQKEQMNELYKETFDALMVILDNKSFDLGVYEKINNVWVGCSK
jgi:hypothetical protein